MSEALRGSNAARDAAERGAAPVTQTSAEWERLAAPLRKLVREDPDAFAAALRSLIGRKPDNP